MAGPATGVQPQGSNHRGSNHRGLWFSLYRGLKYPYKGNDGYHDKVSGHNIQRHAAKLSRPDGPGPVESSIGPTLLCLYRPDGACHFSGRHLLRILGNGILQLPFSTMNASLLFLKILCTE